MRNIARLSAIGLVVLGLVIIAVGVVNWQKASEGLESLDAVYAEQDVTLSYNEDGQLIDRGTTEGADAIMSLLVDDWKFPVNEADFDPNDPLVDTPTELMYQYAVITYHVLHGTETVTLEESVEYNGETFEAGTYEVPVDGRYWTQFDRMHPLEGPARSMAWSGTVHGLLGSLSSGVSADYQAGFAHFAAWRTILVGLAFGLAGVGLYAATSSRKESAAAATSEKEMVNA